MNECGLRTLSSFILPPSSLGFFFVSRHPFRLTIKLPFLTKSSPCKPYKSGLYGNEFSEIDDFGD